MTTLSRGPGYEIVLLHQKRFLPDETEIPDFLMNRPPYHKAQIVGGGRNFGCGSAREAPVWALQACGFRAVIAPSFGDRFFNNCFKNGLLRVVLPDEGCAGLRAQLHENPGAEIAVDLPGQFVTGPDGHTFRFEVPPFRKHCQLNGLDDIGFTLEREADIVAFEKRYVDGMPWLA